MRVLYVETKGVRLNGSQQSLLNLIELLKNEGVEPYLACDEWWELLDETEKCGFRTVVIPYKKLIIKQENMNLLGRLKYPAKIIFNNLQVKKAARYLADNHIDIVHINTTLASEIWASAAKKCGIPYVWHIREFLDLDHKRVLLNKKHTYKLISEADRTIVISKMIKNHWEKALGKTCELVYNGLPAPDSLELNHSRFKGVKLNYIIVGRITEAKGQMDAVKAVEKVLKTGRNNIHLTIVGYRGFDEYELKLKKYIDTRGLSEHIELVDYTYDLAPFRRDSDIGLMCSQAEAFGRVTVEYMMAGLLVFGTNSGGTPELINDGVDGFLYEFGDIDALAQLMIDADDNRNKMKEMALKGRKKALEKFTIERTAAEVLDIYKTIRGGV